jgi:hypothetical protein
MASGFEPAAASDEPRFLSDGPRRRTHQRVLK